MRCPECDVRKMKTLYLQGAIQKWCLRCDYKSQPVILPKEHWNNTKQKNLMGD